MESNSGELRLGDYRLQEQVAASPLTQIWRAEQVSIGRAVWLEKLRDEFVDQAEEFLADVRAKAAIHQPAFASVYEAVSSDGQCYYTYEILEGETLAAWLSKKPVAGPMEWIRRMERIGEANRFLEVEGIASSALQAEHLHFQGNDQVRLANLAIAGERTADHSRRDLAFLGQTLPPLVAGGMPASGRFLVLLSWMRGEGGGSVASWQELLGYLREIVRQLEGPTPSKSNRMRVLIPAICGVIVVGAVVAVITTRNVEPKVERPEAVIFEPISISAGIYEGPDGVSDQLEAFEISHDLISVAEYAKFLQTLEILKKSGRESVFDDRDQPETQSGHVPDSWSDQQAGDLTRPVTGVDWWDAAAFASWKKAKLPDQNEWTAALGELEVSAISEWTREREINPTNPVGGTFWVIIRKGKSSIQREWLEDRSIRRKDLGFRIVSEKR